MISEFRLGDHKKEQLFGHDLNINSLIININEEIPDYVEKVPFGKNISIKIPSLTDGGYWREWVRFISFVEQTNPIEFAITNSSEIPGEHICVEINIEDHEKSLIILTSTNKPSKPNRNYPFNISPRFNNQSIFNVDYKQSDYWKIVTNIERAHPKRLVPISDRLFIGSKSTKTYNLEASIYAANITKPLESKLALHIISNSVHLSWSEFQSNFILKYDR